eukprot:CAMPEP_0173139370 /NCGR_PEP_ID=MMETSP1105-20130129/4221_1 /TAXON_ID=2985 /ORGANISM="Ochromonas sp., Strain BG-1" /LENGTH=760 /DNA_ID=CAMNT_0014052095 /DNA_START=44 /DNA_END=2322 /DNA_ORIENTATION=-
MTGSTAAVLASRTRQRREARIRENYDRIFATLINPDSARFAARHPTRVIPDVPGIFGLSKTEVKKDTKEIEKLSTFAHYPDFADEEELQKRVLTSYRPATSIESSLTKKQQRLQQWCKTDDLNIIHQEIEQKKQEVASFREKLAHLDDHHSELVDSFETARKYITEMFSFLTVQSTTLRKELRRTIEQIISECQVSLPSQYNPFAVHWMTIIQELSQRLMKQKQLFKELSSLLQQHANAPSTPASSGKPAQNQIIIEIGDLQSYPGFSSTLFPSAFAQTAAEPAPPNSNEKKTENGEKMDEDREDAEEEEEPDELLKVFRTLQSAMTRDEDLIEDLELFLQDVSASSSTTSTSVDNSILPTSQGLLEALAIQASEQLAKGNTNEVKELVVKQEATEDSKLDDPAKKASTTFATLFQLSSDARERKVEDSLNQYYQILLNGLDNPSSFTNTGNENGSTGYLSTRKKRNAPNKQSNVELIQGRLTVRSRVERDLPLLFSPISTFEDSYVGAAPIKTVFSQWRDNCEETVSGTDSNLIDHWNKEYYLHSVISPNIRQLEDDLMNSLQLQAAIALSTFQQKKLQTSNEELEKFIHDATISLHKVENCHKQVLIEDYHERNRMKAALVQFGLQAATTTSSNGSNQQQQDLLAGMEGLESLLNMASNGTANEFENSAVGGDSGKSSASTNVLPVAEVAPPVKYKRGTYPRNKGANSASNVTEEQSEVLPETTPTTTAATKRKQPTAPSVLLSQASDVSVTNDSVST